MGQLFSDTSKNEDNKGDLVTSFKAYFKNIDTETNIISPETIHLIESYLSKGDILGANGLISDELKNIESVPINIAVTGESGAGKSSLINALLGIRPGMKGAAKVGVVQTTMKRTPYRHPKIKTLTLWDLPGIGTQEFPQETYVEKMKFKEYDFFIIASATRFTKLELDLAKEIRIMNKNYYFVRTKVDIDLENEKRSNPRTFDREKTLKQIESYSVKNFTDNSMDVPQIFLISNHDLSDYDFPVLMDTLIKDLPAQKRYNFVLSLPNITETAIDRKYETEQQFIWLEAFMNGFTEAVPILSDFTDDDVEKLRKKLNHYRQLFGVDDESLESIARDFQVPVEQLKEKLKSPHLLETNREETLGEKLLKHLEIILQAIRWLLGTCLYIAKIFYLLLYFLKTVAEDAKVLLQWINSNR